MYNSNIPSDSELPSTGKLIKASILAAVTAGILLLFVLKPDQYVNDPTGIGKKNGLTRMGEIKVKLAEEAAADRANNLAVKDDAESAQAEVSVVPKPETRSTGAAILNHEMQVTLAPDEGVEIKVEMSKNNKVQYSWWTDGGKANFDVHGDSKKLNINYHNYSKGSEQRKEGEIEAEFDGSHGWFWRNRTSQTMIITLKVNGEYSDIKKII